MGPPLTHPPSDVQEPISGLNTFSNTEQDFSVKECLKEGSGPPWVLLVDLPLTITLDTKKTNTLWVLHPEAGYVII